MAATEPGAGRLPVGSSQPSMLACGMGRSRANRRTAFRARPARPQDHRCAPLTPRVAGFAACEDPHPQPAARKLDARIAIGRNDLRGLTGRIPLAADAARTPVGDPARSAPIAPARLARSGAPESEGRWRPSRRRAPQTVGRKFACGGVKSEPGAYRRGARLGAGPAFRRGPRPRRRRPDPAAE